MDPDKNEYKIDWDNLTLYVYNAVEQVDYRFILSVNTVYLNNLLADIVKFREER